MIASHSAMRKLSNYLEHNPDHHLNLLEHHHDIVAISVLLFAFFVFSNTLKFTKLTSGYL